MQICGAKSCRACGKSDLTLWIQGRLLSCLRRSLEKCWPDTKNIQFSWLTSKGTGNWCPLMLFPLQNYLQGITKMLLSTVHQSYRCTSKEDALNFEKCWMQIPSNHMKSKKNSRIFYLALYVHAHRVIECLFGASNVLLRLRFNETKNGKLLSRASFCVQNRWISLVRALHTILILSSIAHTIERYSHSFLSIGSEVQERNICSYFVSLTFCIRLA